MDQNQNQTTGTELVGDAAPQNATPPVPATPVTPVPAVTPVTTTETEAERGLRSGIEAERRKRQEVEAQLAQSNLLLMQVASQMRQPQAPAPVEQDFLGLSDQDLLDPAKVRQGLLKVRQDAMTAVQQGVAQLQFQIQNPDFDALVGVYDPATAHLPPEHRRFLQSEFLQEAFTEDPALQTKIMQSGNPRLFAYEVAKRQKQIRQLRQGNTATTNQQQTVANRNAVNTAAALTAPMSPMAVGGPPASAPDAQSVDMLLKNPQILDDIIRGMAVGRYG